MLHWTKVVDGDDSFIGKQRDSDVRLKIGPMFFISVSDAVNNAWYIFFCLRDR